MNQRYHQQRRPTGFVGAGAGIAGAGCIAIMLNLAFWLGLIFGALWIARHFGVI